MPWFYSVCILYLMKYSPNSLCIALLWLYWQYIENACDLFIDIHQGWFIGSNVIIILSQCRWSKTEAQIQKFNLMLSNRICSYAPVLFTVYAGDCPSASNIKLANIWMIDSCKSITEIQDYWNRFTIAAPDIYNHSGRFSPHHGCQCLCDEWQQGICSHYRDQTGLND